MKNIHYQIHSDNISKPWIVLIHGLFGSLDNLSGLRRLFSNDFQVLSIDLPDHGKSTTTQGFSFDGYAQLIYQQITELNIDSLVLLGHSLGGKVAMKMALEHPTLVKQLVVIDIAPVAYPPRHQQVIMGLTNIKLDQIVSRKQADEALQQYVAEPGVRMFLLKSLYQGESGWEWRFNLPLLKRDYSILSGAIESNNTFEKPVLFIKGGDSDYLLAEHRSLILSLFPKSQSKVVGNTGHWLHAEKPDLCHKIVCDFLRYGSKV
ncbi:alpha/beta fold hydrolase [Paraglaciecola sp.]|uniref:alpha/beta fold hydrolase n=1 Tax=Paraglaciecola sp. TaxID=1920173 RepID=UPI003EF6588C